MAAVDIKNSETFMAANGEHVDTMDFALRLQELQERLSREEDSASNLNSSKKKLEGEVSNLKKEIEDLQLVIQKVRGYFQFL